MMKYLYQYKVSRHVNEVKENSTVKYDIFTPSIRERRYILPNETVSIKTILVRFRLHCMTFGKLKIFYVSVDDKLVHTSYVVPKCYKFDFLGKNDYEIGPCFTYPEYRGQGIYPNILRTICQQIGSDDTTFYMIVDEENKPSIRGIEKAGFIKCGSVKVSKTKRYCYIKEQ